MKDPIDFFRKTKIPISHSLTKKIESYNFEKNIPSESFVLPNGKHITPKIRININTKRK